MIATNYKTTEAKAFEIVPKVLASETIPSPTAILKRSVPVKVIAFEGKSET